jgi:D-lactate dehydrogenase
VTDEIVDLVLTNGGTLKAEHGTGRIMAPFIERQYGAELTDVMRTLKALCDPAGVLNPGVIITDDEQTHLKHLKTTPTVEAEVDRCVECGYCEPTCPSRGVTLTPRQRIVVRRELAAAEARGDNTMVKALLVDEPYESVQTCAVDGLCAIACPVNINTGDLVRRLRSEGRAPGRGLWNAAANQWGATTRIASLALTAPLRAPYSAQMSCHATSLDCLAAALAARAWSTLPRLYGVRPRQRPAPQPPTRLRLQSSSLHALARCSGPKVLTVVTKPPVPLPLCSPYASERA